MQLSYFQRFEEYFCWAFGIFGLVSLHLMTLSAHVRAAEDLSRPEQS